ncbi:MAG: DUF3422 family protein [Alphaproteobacteria bacterium]|nr:DUF3422 family protein [Alphaproteobacteria bacterium]
MDDQRSVERVLRSHPDRAAVAAEIHTRPPPELGAPVSLSHLTLVSGREGAAADREFLTELCRSYSALPPDAGATLHSATLGQLELRWERHTEFSTYMFVREGAFGEPFAEPAVTHIGPRWLERLPGELIAANHLVVLPDDAPKPEREQLSRWFEGHHLLSGRVQGEDVQLWTSLRLHADGFGRFVVKNAGYDRLRLGRLVQRVLELDTYRLMALLGLTQARRSGEALAEMEQRLLQLTVGMTDADDAQSERQLLDELSDLAAEHARASADGAFRFSATRAYAELVHERLARLRLERNDDMEIVSSFLARRFEPAMRTCRAVEGRMEGLGARLARAADLLRTRVDLALQEQNQALLVSMDRRAKLQLRLQQTVEGLSVAAVSYYIVGLWSYLLELIAPALGPQAVGFATGLAVPVVVGGVWTGVRRLRARIGH